MITRHNESEQSRLKSSPNSDTVYHVPWNMVDAKDTVSLSKPRRQHFTPCAMEHGVTLPTHGGHKG